MLFSCKSGKYRQYLKYKTNRDISLQELFTALDSTEHKYDFLTCKLSAKVKMDGSSSSIGGKVRARNNEVIWISIFPTQVLELLRIKATTDSVLMVNYIEKKYFKGTYDFFKQNLKFDLDFKTLESILFAKNHTLFDRNSYINSFENGKYFLSNTDHKTFEKTIHKKDHYPTILHGIWIEPSNLKMTKQIIYDPVQKRLLIVEYKNYEYIERDFIPSKFEIILQTPETNLKSVIEYNKLDLKTQVSFPLNIPGKYEEIN